MAALARLPSCLIRWLLLVAFTVRPRVLLVTTTTQAAGTAIETYSVSERANERTNEPTNQASQPASQLAKAATGTWKCIVLVCPSVAAAAAATTTTTTTTTTAVQ